MNRYFPIIVNTAILIILVAQVFIYYYNSKSSTKVFSQKNISVENFSSIVFGKSGMTKIGSKKLNKINDSKIFLEGKSYLENDEYKIYGSNIAINLENSVSESNYNVEVINSMGVLNAKGFKNSDLDGKILFYGDVIFKSHD
mgnify:FL=1|tara:strand:+ start:189 stop:614 length:426 start_codon:yes stop_codon:yes gene_type:complete